MSVSVSIDRRRFRRTEIDVPVLMRSVEVPMTSLTGQVKNVGLSGFYCYVSASSVIKAGEQVICAIGIPSEQRHTFPFTRLLGKGTVVRVEPVPVGRRAGDMPSSEPLLGLGVAFMPDVTALGTITGSDR